MFSVGRWVPRAQNMASALYSGSIQQRPSIAVAVTILRHTKESDRALVRTLSSSYSNSSSNSSYSNCHRKPTPVSPKHDRRHLVTTCSPSTASPLLGLNFVSMSHRTLHLLSNRRTLRLYSDCLRPSWQLCDLSFLSSCFGSSATAPISSRSFSSTSLGHGYSEDLESRIKIFHCSTCSGASE